MKNLKNMLAAASLMAVLGISTVSATTGLMISDRTANTPKTCTVKGGGVLQQISGVIISGLSGLMISDLHGVIISGAPTPECTDANGLMISDRSGLMISD